MESSKVKEREVKWRDSDGNDVVQLMNYTLREVIQRKRFTTLVPTITAATTTTVAT